MIRPLSFLFSLSLFALTFTLGSVAEATNAPQLREILNKHWEAMGGMRNWSKVESIRLNGTIERGGQLVDICIVKKRPNQIRATVTLPLPGSDDEKLQVIRAHDGKTAWTATRLAGGPMMRQEELPAEAAAGLLADAGVLPRLIKLWREGAELQLLEPTLIDGETVLTIRGTSESSDGSDTFFLSPETHLLLAHEADHSAKGKSRTSFADYVTKSGIKLPTRNVIETSESSRSVITTESLEVGIGIYEDYFRITSGTETALSE